MRSCPIPLVFLFLLLLQPRHDVSDVVKDLVEAWLGDNVKLRDLEKQEQTLFKDLRRQDIEKKMMRQKRSDTSLMDFF